MTRSFRKFAVRLMGLSLSCSVAAETLVVRAPSASPVEYGAYLRASADRVSPIQVYRREHPSAEMRRLLLQRLTLAQQSFLSGSLEAARSGFLAVAQMRTEDDWGATEREVFFVSLFRLAQLSSSAEERDEFLASALTLGEELQPEARLFPPPLLSRWQELRASRKPIVVSTVGLIEWETVLIDGRAFSLAPQGELRLRPGRYRVTYLSSSRQPVTRILAPENISEPPTAVDLVEGKCGDWKLTGTSQPAHAFFGLACNAPSRAQNATTKTTTALLETTRSLNPQIDFRPPADGMLVNLKPSSSKDTPLIKRPWVWTLAGATLAALIVVQARSREGRETTTSHGFN